VKVVLKIDEMNREEIAEKISDSLVIIPVGAIEQHGPHLPINTDTVIIDAITSRVCDAMSAEYPVFKAPVVSYGNSHHHFPFPTMSLKSETLISLLKDLVQSLVTFGCKNILILNSHGGNDEAIRIVARDMSRICQVSIGAASYWTIARSRLINECNVLDLGRVPGHAGGFETSLMLALTPENVRLEKRPPCREDNIPKVDNARRIYVSRPNNSVGIGGYSDDARHAAKDIGEKALSIIVEEIVKTAKEYIEKKI